ncbi:phosphate acetyltransferase [Ornithinimicrobium tianjinense]|uniref:Phosphate acetyltransferase n=1 Tax=Ornithinimicrobium tianjinense TaxID=1195761 RepID=A0A917BJQ1_9MICO|nr:phosphate acetyltransferase [Ornithinimicrobium tianjinense]GGF46642.1 phosphate acetyltransferase [Ornithinimicrobium tianjinense]
MSSATALYLSSAESQSGKSALAVGLLAEACARGGRVGVFRPLVLDRAHDPLIELLHPLSTSPLEPAAGVGVTYEEMRADPEAATSSVVDRFHTFAADHDTVLVVGSDFTDVPTPTEFSTNAALAAHLGAPMVLVVPGTDRSVEECATAAELIVHEARSRHADVAALVANRVNPDQLEQVRDVLTRRLPEVPSVFAVPADALLSAPTVHDLMASVDGRLLLGDETRLDREVTGFVVAGMTMPHVLDRLREGCVLICPGDREEVLLATILAHRSSTFPSLSAVVLNGGFLPTPQVTRLMEGLGVELPIISCTTGTMSTATAMHAVRGRIGTRSSRKIERARALVHGHVDIGALLPSPSERRGAGHGTRVVTPLMFEHDLTARAREADAHIVLPEGTEPRILRAADTLLARRVARLTLLGDEAEVRDRAASLGLHLDEAAVIDPRTSPLREEFTTTYAELRAHKGMTPEQAHDLVTDGAYFGTLMVHGGHADGMVSGSITSTAHTVRPALEVIRTAPGVSVVSSVFFMCLADRVLVYGDCAINPDPTAEQLADIAISSARTAAQFGVEPRVAMLSYSTGGSGSGADVDKVRTATAHVRERAPELLVEGPIQYDAAVDPAVAATKLQGSPVAGHATVLVFPDLNTGNNTYKAVQRSASAVAVGPVLQGLNAPVNDLSRGATVRDIVNTVAITAIQARG